MTFAPAIVLAALLIQTPARSGTTADIQSMSWMAGHWVGVETQDLSEELWLPVAADAMVGVWRWASSGTMRLYELLTIANESGAVVLRLRHFRPDLSALEEKDKPFVLPMVRSSANEAVFEGAGSDGGVLRITYKRVGADRLEATVERSGKVDRFAYRLQK